EYDAKTYGSVIGVDKNFGNLLIGLAGGAGVADIDAGDIYQADVTTYHGSLYSTLGGEDVFIDLALTYGSSETDSKNTIADDSFDSFIVSGYVGGGKSFNAGESLKVTPEASLLTSYYEQDGYNRAGLIQKTINAYDEWSYLASVGVSLSTRHQIDWMSNGLALIPEIRAHWLHEFNADLKDFSYTTGAGRQSFGVRPREEDLFRLGLGFDIWNWKYQSIKLELDYDGLFSSDYTEHAVSGKITLAF
ncbi:MAG: autotransporter outer membrane beta-barrel domain-containing protein, partial [Pontiella sp.]|nr:autotransporter outer membrane beta-barrel domain-containing protein [Pontiella sp.]